MLLTGATTITGFGSLMTAQFAGLRSIGLAAVVGIAGALLSALTLLPLLLPRKPS
jgi:predicted RND superfamily exporter protein